MDAKLQRGVPGEIWAGESGKAANENMPYLVKLSPEVINKRKRQERGPPFLDIYCDRKERFPALVAQGQLSKGSRKASIMLLLLNSPITAPSICGYIWEGLDEDVPLTLTS